MSQLKRRTTNPYSAFTRAELEHSIEYAYASIRSGLMSSWAVEVLERNIRVMEGML